MVIVIFYHPKHCTHNSIPSFSSQDRNLINRMTFRHTNSMINSESSNVSFGTKSHLRQPTKVFKNPKGFSIF